MWSLHRFMHPIHVAWSPKMAPVMSPAELGFRMPAEWESQEAIWISWPHNRETWPGAFEPIPVIFSRIVREVAESQLVRINVVDATMASNVRTLLNSQGVNLNNVQFHLNPTNDCWVRDHGPIYLVRETGAENERGISAWDYNAWGGKYPPYDLDNAIPHRIAREFRERCFEPGMVLEGGSVDVNGVGTLITTESCLLHPNRNPKLDQDDIEARLRAHLGVRRILWLGEGIMGDDTDGHVDDLTRFVAPRTVVTAVEINPHDANYRPLQVNRERLQAACDQDGNSLEIVELPMPDPVFFETHRLPASYANFLITNDKVLVPVYACPQDPQALEILQGLFPTRNVVGIDCRHLVWGLGAIHCVTQQQPNVDTNSNTDADELAS